MDLTSPVSSSGATQSQKSWRWLVTEAGADWDLARLRPYTEHLLRCFGGERLMFGSDWPVVTNASSYARWFEAAWALVPADDRAAVFGQTTARFYGVTLPPG